MADIGRDGTTTVGKLEGFQIGLQAKRSRFTASGVLSLGLLSITWSFQMVLPAFQTMMYSSVDRLIRAYDQRQSHFQAPGGVDIDYVRNTQRTGEYALEDRDDASTAKAHHLLNSPSMKS